MNPLPHPYLREPPEVLSKGQRTEGRTGFLHYEYRDQGSRSCSDLWRVESGPPGFPYISELNSTVSSGNKLCLHSTPPPTVIDGPRVVTTKEIVGLHLQVHGYTFLRSVFSSNSYLRVNTQTLGGVPKSCSLDVPSGLSN